MPPSIDQAITAARNQLGPLPPRLAGFAQKHGMAAARQRFLAMKAKGGRGYDGGPTRDPRGGGVLIRPQPGNGGGIINLPPNPGPYEGGPATHPGGFVPPFDPRQLPGQTAVGGGAGGGAAQGGDGGMPVGALPPGLETRFTPPPGAQPMGGEIDGGGFTFDRPVSLPPSGGPLMGNANTASRTLPSTAVDYGQTAVGGGAGGGVAQSADGGMPVGALPPGLATRFTPPPGARAMGAFADPATRMKKARAGLIGLNGGG